MAAKQSGRQNVAFNSSELVNDSKTHLLIQQSAVIPSCSVSSFQENPNDMIYE